MVNHQQTDFLEEIRVEDESWVFNSKKLFAEPYFRIVNKRTCLSSSSEHLVSMSNPDYFCNKIVSNLCKEGECTPEDIKFAPTLTLQIDTYSFTFTGKDYLYLFDSDGTMKLKCRFGKINVLSKCKSAGLVLGKAFFEKYSPMFQFKLRDPNGLGSGVPFESFVAFIEFRPKFKPSWWMKYVLLGVITLILLICLLVYLKNRLTIVKVEDSFSRLNISYK